MTTAFQDYNRLSDLISAAPELLLVMSRFGISPGCGLKSIAQVCEEAGVDTDTFLAISNFTIIGPEAATRYAEKVSVEALLSYLKRAHEYYLGFMLPQARRKLLLAMDCSRQNEVAFLILNFFDKYTDEVRRHMQHEERNVFKYVEALLKGEKRGGFSIEEFADSHTGIDKRLQELKNIIIKYYTPTESIDMFNSVVYDLFNIEADLHTHCLIEDSLFVPAVRLLEQNVSELPARETDDVSSANFKVGSENLSEREKEIVCHVVKGFSNKEIAEKLFISIHTVQTHRKNITRKLNIHSTSGLTIYAIVNKLVALEDVPLA